jgi:hypothetical protein
MHARRLLRYVLAVTVLAVAFAIALGEPPPKGTPDPGVTVTGSL